MNQCYEMWWTNVMKCDIMTRKKSISEPNTSKMHAEIQHLPNTKYQVSSAKERQPPPKKVLITRKKSYHLTWWVLTKHILVQTSNHHVVCHKLNNVRQLHLNKTGKIKDKMLHRKKYCRNTKFQYKSFIKDKFQVRIVG